MIMKLMLDLSLFIHFQVLWRQFLKFKETELPAKEADKNRSKHIFKSFEVSYSNKSAFFSCPQNVLKGIFILYSHVCNI